MTSPARLFRTLSVLPMAIASAALFFLMILTFFDVVLRSAFNAPIEAATELTRMSIAIVVFSVMPIMSGTGQQISVDLLDPIFDRFRLSRARDALVALSCGIMLFWPAQRVIVLAERSRSYGDVTEYLSIPVFYIGWFIAIMTGLTGVILVLRGLAIIFAPKLLEPTL